VRRFLGLFTFIAMNDVDKLTNEGGSAMNYAKDVLAFEVTALIHGFAAAEAAQESARKAFGIQHDVSGDAIPHAAIPDSELEAGIPLVNLVVRAGLETSNSAARRLIQGGGVSLHADRVDDPNRNVTTADVRDGFVLI